MIGIITDSTCDIPQPLIVQYDITVIPQVLIWGEQQLRDRIDIQPEAFYHRLSTDPVRPHSSLPMVGDIQHALQTAVQRGATQLVVLTVSRAMSGTYDLVERTARDMGIKVSMVDARGPSMSLGWQVLAAARLRDEGADLPALLKRINQVREKLVQLVAMDSLEYLQRGGRIGGAVKWVGSVLNIKPLVAINHQSGQVEPVSLARTHHSLVDLLYSRFIEKVGSKGKLHIAVLHGNVIEEAQALAQRLKAEYHPLEILVNITGPVLGLNTGPGALALCGYAEDWE